MYGKDLTSKGMCTNDMEILPVGAPCWKAENCGATTQFECLGVKIEGDPSKWVAGHCAYKPVGAGNECAVNAEEGKSGKCSEGLKCASVDNSIGKCTDGKIGSYCGTSPLAPCVDTEKKYLLGCVVTTNSKPLCQCYYLYYNFVKYKYN